MLGGRFRGSIWGVYCAFFGVQVHILGSSAALGGGEGAKAVPLVATEKGLWEVQIKLPRTEFPIRYPAPPHPPTQPLNP